MMKKILLIFLAATLAGCQGGITEYVDDFPDNRWLRTREITVDVELEKGVYSMDLEMSYVYQGIPAAAVPIEVDVIQAGRIVYSQTVSFGILDADGNALGDCTGDYCDTSQQVLQSVSLDGTYHIRLRQRFDYEFLPNIMRAGVRFRDQ